MNKKNKVRTLYTFLFETEFTDQSTFTKKNSTRRQDRNFHCYNLWYKLDSNHQILKEARVLLLKKY